MRLLAIGLCAAPVLAAYAAAKSTPLLPLTPGPLPPSGERGPVALPPPIVPSARGLAPLAGSSAAAGSAPPDAPSLLAMPRAGHPGAAARARSQSPAARLLAPAAASLELGAAIDGAAERTPALQGFAARRDLVAAKRRAAEAFLPAAPTIAAAFVTDQAVRNRRARDAELSVSTPIWLPGEGGASVRAADADFARLQAQALRQRLDVAGLVREQLATVAIAEADARAAGARLADARALEADFARRVRAAEAAETESLVAAADRLDAQAALSDKTAVLEAARVEYRALTGREANTAALNEREASAPGSDDPRLAEARRAIGVAQAGRDLAAIQVRDNPEIGLVGRRFRDIGGSVDDNALGVQLRIPLATKARNAPRRALAEADYVDAIAGLASLERDLTARTERARIELASAAAGRDLAIKRADVFARQRALMERSFAGGEVPLADVIRVRTQAFQADAARDRADIGLRQARSRLNQALGVMP